MKKEAPARQEEPRQFKTRERKVPMNGRISELREVHWTKSHDEEVNTCKEKKEPRKFKIVKMLYIKRSNQS